MESIVGTLVDMDLVDLEEPGPWPGEPEAHSVHRVDWSAVHGDWAEDEYGPTYAGASNLTDAIAPAGRWARLGEQIRERASQGFHTPPDQILDAQAWYLPIHYYGPASAIYITEQSCLVLAACLMRNLPQNRWGDLDAVEGCTRAALSLLYLHEAFHHKVESLAIRFEAVERVRRYLPYHQNVYTRLQREQSDELLEEALACAEMFRRFKNEILYKRGVPADLRFATLEYLPDYFRSLPPGYRRAMDFVDDKAFVDALWLLHSEVHEATVTPVRDDREWQLAPQMLRSRLDCRSIAHVIVPTGTTPIIPWVGEQLPEFPQVGSKEIIGLAERRGWKVVPGGGKGSHVKLRCPGRPAVIVPGNRRALSPGVLRTLATGLGVRVSDLPGLVRG